MNAQASIGPNLFRPHTLKIMALLRLGGEGVLRVSVMNLNTRSQKGLVLMHSVRWSMLSIAILHILQVWSGSSLCLLRTFVARWRCLRHAFSSLASDRRVPRDGQMRSQGVILFGGK